MGIEFLLKLKLTYKAHAFTLGALFYLVTEEALI